MRPGFRLLLLLPLAALASCGPGATEGLMLDTERTPSGLLTARMRDLDARVRSVEGRGSVTFETPSLGGSASFTLALQRPDSLLVQLEGPFGIDVGTLFLSRGRYVLYNSLENTVARGAPSGASFHSVLPVDLTYDQMFSAFTGTFPLPDGEPPLAYSVEEGEFLLRYRCGDGVCLYWVDPEALLVRRFQMRDGAGEVRLEGETSGTIEQDGARIPRRVTLTMPREERRVAIAFARASINAGRLSFEFTVPPNARELRSPR
jgi:hypothetical protein